MITTIIHHNRKKHTAVNKRAGNNGGGLMNRELGARWSSVGECWWTVRRQQPENHQSTDCHYYHSTEGRAASARAWRCLRLQMSARVSVSCRGGNPRRGTKREIVSTKASNNRNCAAKRTTPASNENNNSSNNNNNNNNNNNANKMLNRTRGLTWTFPA